IRVLCLLWHRRRRRRRRPGVVVLRPRVEPHRLIDEVIDGAVEVVRHLLERLPKDVPAVEVAHRLLALVHLRSWLSRKTPLWLRPGSVSVPDAYPVLKRGFSPHL